MYIIDPGVMHQPKDDDLTKTTCDKQGAEGQPRRGDCNQGEGCRTRVPPDLRATPGTSLTYTNMFVERVGHDTAGDDHRPLQLSDTLMSLSEWQKNSTNRLFVCVYSYLKPKG